MKRVFKFLLAIFMFCNANATEYHISKQGNDSNAGNVFAPFLTISKAASIAKAGDVITVHEGVYRERIDPQCGGTNDINRIVYQAAEGERVVIKGSEVINNWKKEKGTVWKVEISNEFFGDYNPYADTLFGDWLNKKEVKKILTGEVFLNGKSLFQKDSLEHVYISEAYEDALDKASSTYTWYAEVDETKTTIWANFQKKNPNKELVEISTRDACFYPSQPGINFITVRGFTMSQAATQWAAPTAEQPGLIGTHWSKGWIIENNTVSNSKCVGISLGKDKATGHNDWSFNRQKDGATHYNEVIFKAHKAGWSKEKIGSHIVCNNTIHSCGQAGVVGSLGAIFSEIYNNHIYDIWTKRIFDGFEQGGIKIHGAIDVLIKGNRIHNTRAGIWLDWMAQGTRVTRNIIYDNTAEDMNVEVNHGPFLIDNNIFLSPMSLFDMSEGGAYVHNLFAGSFTATKNFSRATPYHLSHSTDVKALRNNGLGDNRFLNNIFVKPDGGEEKVVHKSRKIFYGLHEYEMAQYVNFATGNIYYNGAKPGKEENNSIESPSWNPSIQLVEKQDGLYLSLNVDNQISEVKTSQVNTELLGTTIVSEALYENPDGSPLNIDTDFKGNKRNDNPTPGPFANIKKGITEIKVW